jgi:hypothetical protein
MQQEQTSWGSSGITVVQVGFRKNSNVLKRVTKEDHPCTKGFRKNHHFQTSSSVSITISKHSKYCVPSFAQ